MVGTAQKIKPWEKILIVEVLGHKVGYRFLVGIEIEGRVCDSRLRNEFYLPKFYTEDVLGWFADHILAVQEMRPNFHPDEVKLDKTVIESKLTHQSLPSLNFSREERFVWNTKRWWSCIVFGSLIGNLGEKDKKSESSKITEAEKEVSIEKNSGTKGEKLTVGMDSRCEDLTVTVNNIMKSDVLQF
ncbi:hypothetical protein OIU79_018353 [Salix purpurea]|uniref:Uncharacterized protein n=1 Tax=Salix purpurea TaxID=77065 RepID=A0A9Q1AL81_SALPP|nr:hypothetical protein OIU79_018353 [Salix purpurea]